MPLTLVEGGVGSADANAVVCAVNSAEALRRAGIMNSNTYESSERYQPDDLMRSETGEPRKPGDAFLLRGHNAYAPGSTTICVIVPPWQGGSYMEASSLASCYRNSLMLAREEGAESIELPLLGTGFYGYPKQLVLNTALTSIREFLMSEDMDIFLDIWSRNEVVMPEGREEALRQYFRQYGEYANVPMAPPRERQEEKSNRKLLFDRIRAFLHKKKHESFDTGPDDAAGRVACDELITEAPHFQLMGQGDLRTAGFGAAEPPMDESSTAGRPMGGPLMGATVSSHPSQSQPFPTLKPYHSLYEEGKDRGYERTLSYIMEIKGESFQQRLLRLIDDRGFTDVEVYKKANIDRKHFSKIRCNTDYNPKKRTAVALAIALELDMAEASELIRCAGFAFSPGNMFDLIIRFCIENRIYNIFDVNAILYKFGQPILG